MRRSTSFVAALVAGAIALAPSLGLARAGFNSSMGSRGSMTYSAPPSTRTAPSYAAPMERSLTQPAAPSYGSAAPSYARPGFGGGFAGGRSPFMSGLMGGLIGAGIGGMLLGHGMFGGIDGIGSLLGLVLQVLLVVFLVRLAFRFFARRAVPAGGPGMFARCGLGGGAMGMGPMGMGGGSGNPAAAPAVSAVAIGPDDYTAFERTLKDVQAAWSAHDLPRLQGVSTPEMVSYFAEQLSEQTSRGVRNTVGDVKLESGDLSQAWSEGGREYATVAMRFSMVDFTRDGSGRLVDGDPETRTMATEIWTFVRARTGGRWLLSAIQQTR